MFDRPADEVWSVIRAFTTRVGGHGSRRRHARRTGATTGSGGSSREGFARRLGGLRAYLTSG
ncbi:MAG: hypothetical protein J2P24_07495 [Streptosporangiales bacterium]|nr:hypothetical protein [Streptosporangiales bacterium]MBO0890610.1 hypothetical protein [Acidothermales bacterium]